MNLKKFIDIEDYKLPIDKDLLMSPKIKQEQLINQVNLFENTRQKTYYRLINESKKKRALFFNNIDESLQIRVIRRPKNQQNELHQVKQNNQNLSKELSRKHLWRK